MGVLAWDVGTSSVKAAVLDPATGAPLGEVTKASYPLVQPTPDHAVLDAEQVWQAVLATGRAAAAGRAIDGIGFSVLTPGLILLDDRSQPLGPIVTHLDRRSRPEARSLLATLGSEFLTSTGNKPLPGGISAVVFRALLREHPELANRVRRYLHVNSWLGHRMTGEFAFDPGNACFSGLLDTFQYPWKWSERWCAVFEVNPAWLPGVCSGDATLGGLVPDVARELGIPAGIPVKLGVPDTSAAALAGRLTKGEMLHVVGTTQVVAALADPPLPSEFRLTRPLGVGTGFIHVAHNPVGGVALDWLHQLCFRDQTAATFYGQTVPAASGWTSEVDFAPPFLGGDRLEIEARSAGFQNLTLATHRMDLLAALLAAMRAGHASAIAALALPTPPRRVVLTGGGADVVHRLIPAYQTCAVELLDQASLRGVARLFDPA